MLITTPYAVALGIRDDGSVLVLDSHAHGPRQGALLAVSSMVASPQSVALYLARFFTRHYACSNQILLRSGVSVPREFTFGLVTVSQ